MESEDSFFTAKPVSMPMTTYMYSENIIMMFGASLADDIRTLQIDDQSAEYGKGYRYDVVRC